MLAYDLNAQVFFIVDIKCNVWFWTECPGTFCQH